jgi:hypothetical protein
MLVLAWAAAAKTVTLKCNGGAHDRLTDAHSKKWQNHEAAVALFITYYNFCRSHQTLTARNERKTTPAMKGGLATEVWGVEKLLEEVNRQ